MAVDPVTAGLTLADKIFSFFTGEKWDDIRNRKHGDKLKADTDKAYANWMANKSDMNWRIYQDADQKLSDWSHTG